MTTTRIPGFYRLSTQERLDIVTKGRGLTEDELSYLSANQTLPMDLADSMIENVVGQISIPVGIATNFKINGKDTFIPMATEEPSVVAAASNAAKATYEHGGFFTSMSGTIMRGQIQVLNVADPYAAKAKIFEHKEEIMNLCNEKDPTLVSLGGGVKDLEVHIIPTTNHTMLVIHLIVDTRDAMGANAVNTMAESVAPMIETITGGRVLLRIISNLADRRLVRARAVFSAEALGGKEVVKDIVSAYEFAEFDPYRAATHNKGIMNGISAVVLATGNDTRAVEAGAHAYASISGHYKSLTKFEINADGDLSGSIELPMAVGIVGGATKTHPVAKASLKIMGISSAEELAGCIAATGLAQNAAGLRALASEGIQRGHMSLHARNLAVMAGAAKSDIDRIVAQAVAEKDLRYDRILEITKAIQRGE
ncbi:hydroxymethylglutaryl-CoA reductase, degradative [Sporosarcina thermotolerans]|uniref:3-hydroxy-3-methylglutaryl coenzyme A reductase n=1 Tax=Sporosarcina thermotolerans TaxID=633404 RepID=A0AAW9A5V3_9BACL|nr:hydroxymethylglutaryl-CoA reductase, degradative [Sporosarcina thermotolerans]MDW0115928.1 hydroxymethylglutaryl-CoA reductase, degradative [Sporosarcina thermotolerans]WHT46855.1 hydroxymethylglutaryl-CoA reductase, degradative [Sporosarcina thermotolerans]